MLELCPGTPVPWVCDLTALYFAASPSTVAEYELPMVYYGINGALMTGHAAFGAFACVKAENLKVLKIYTAIGRIYNMILSLHDILMLCYNKITHFMLCNNFRSMKCKIIIMIIF